MLFPFLQSLTEGITLPPKGKNLNFTTDPISMSQQVDFFQENIPEVLDIKRKSLKSIAEVTKKEIIKFFLQLLVLCQQNYNKV
ncbi:MAG: hypothetical protein CM1200mP13_13140 [Candidatus Pelagibacterales bacterium]|nr:MAG: hypothetical protein CM1200mP13_13140 [Pelagibacterales bacterium]